MATAACDYRLKTESYVEQRDKHWPTLGRHILGQFDERCIVVYQAFCPEIADYAVQHGKFGGRELWVVTLDCTSNVQGGQKYSSLFKTP